MRFCCVSISIYRCVYVSPPHFFSARDIWLQLLLSLFAFVLSLQMAVESPKFALLLLLRCTKICKTRNHNSYSPDHCALRQFHPKKVRSVCSPECLAPHLLLRSLNFFVHVIVDVVAVTCSAPFDYWHKIYGAINAIIFMRTHLSTLPIKFPIRIENISVSSQHQRQQQQPTNIAFGNWSTLSQWTRYHTFIQLENR